MHGNMTEKQRVGFYKFSSFSLVNKFFLSALRDCFPEYEIECIDVESLFRRRDIRNIISTTWFYFWDIVFFRRKLRGLLIHSPYYFKRIREAARRHTFQRNYRFTIQTQSLWDASTPGIQHFVYTDHTELAYRKYKGFNRLEYPARWIALEHQVYHNTILNFTTSNFAKSSIEKDYGVSPERVSCVYSGINTDLPLPHSLPEREYRSRNILFVGVQWERKGGPQLMEAYRTLKKRNPDITLTVIGCTPNIQDEGVEILGFIDRDSINHHLQNAQVFCLPSIADPSAVAVIEAYLYGVPVVATDVGGMQDRVINRQTGYLTEPGNVGQLIDCLETLLNNEALCRAYGRQGFELTVRHFTWSAVAQKISCGIKTCLHERNPN